MIDQIIIGRRRIYGLRCHVCPQRASMVADILVERSMHTRAGMRVEPF